MQAKHKVPLRNMLFPCKRRGFLTRIGDCMKCWAEANNEKPKWFVNLAPESNEQCRALNKPDSCK